MKSQLQSQFIPLTYQSQPQYSQQQREFCNAISINHNNTILIAAADKHLNFQFQRSQIKVMEIIYSKANIITNLIQIQLIQDHHFGFINTLNFFKKNPSMLNYFISGSQDKQIIIWSIENIETSRYWKPIFKLKEHSSIITCIVLRPYSEDLIISACDKKITFWSLSSYQFLSPLIQLGWECIQTIKEHKNYVFGLSINREGNRLVSCGYCPFQLSNYKSFLFLMLKKVLLICIVLMFIFIEIEFRILLNQNYLRENSQIFVNYFNVRIIKNMKKKENIKIGLSIIQYDKQILIIEELSKRKWGLKQKIQTQNVGFRICFINQNLFAYQPYEASLQLYQFNIAIQKFEKFKEIPVQGQNSSCSPYFPSSYIKSQNLLVSKNGYHLNFIRFQYSQNESQEFQCQLESSIELDQKGSWGYIYGSLSDDGRLLVTWDLASEQIQIRTQIIQN